jgi:hypothetical protein
VATEDTAEPEEAAEVKAAEDTTTKKEPDPKVTPNAEIAATTTNRTSVLQKGRSA